MNRMRKVSRGLAFRRLFAKGLKKKMKKVGAQSDILKKNLYICGGIYKKDRRMEINIKKVFLSVWRLVLHAFSRWRILSRSMSIKDNAAPSSSLPPTWVTPAPYICVRAFLYSNPANDIISDLKHNMDRATFSVCRVFGNNVLLPPSSCRLMPKD